MKRWSNLISHTTTRRGLSIRSELDRNEYPDLGVP